VVGRLLGLAVACQIATKQAGAIGALFFAWHITFFRRQLGQTYAHPILLRLRKFVPIVPKAEK
jgi:hypothetical protein